MNFFKLCLVMESSALVLDDNLAEISIGYCWIALQQGFGWKLLMCCGDIEEHPGPVRFVLNLILCEGVNNEKWYKPRKVKPANAALIAKTSDEQDYLKREEVYTSHREDLTGAFRLSSNIV